MNSFLAFLWRILSKIIEYTSSWRTKVESSALVDKTKFVKIKRVKKHSPTDKQGSLTKED